jgi:uncharacterized membrane protein
VAGAIIENGVDYGCYGRCTLPFIWTASGGTEVHSLLGQIRLYDTEYGGVSLPVEEVVGVTAEAALMNGSGGYFNEPFLFVNNAHTLLREVNQESPALHGAAISDDAQVIAGSIHNPDWTRQPVRWTAATGISAISVDRPTAIAIEISGDGRVIAGTSGSDIYDPYIQAFRWSESEGVTFLDSLHPRGGSVPTGISDDGSVIVGTARGGQGCRAYRWTSDHGTVPLELPGGFAANAADAVSADGEIIVGRLMVIDSMGLGGTLGWAPSGIDYLGAVASDAAVNSHAMIWDAAHGTRHLKDVLIQEYGLAHELSGWSLISASAISGNGNVIAGVGVNPAGEFQGWVVIIPEPEMFYLAVGWLAILVLRPSRRW